MQCLSICLQQDDPSQLTLRIADKTWTAPIPVLMTDDGERTVRWYFEDYAEKDPTSTKKASRAEFALSIYGTLLVSALQLEGHAQTCFAEQVHVQIEVGSHRALHQILWESLEEAQIWPGNCLPAVVFVSRKVLPDPFTLPNTAISQWGPSLYGQLNIAVVSSRPRFSNDIPSQLVATSVFEAVASSKQNIHVQIVRPGTWEEFAAFCRRAQPGQYQLIHFDLHGTIIDDERTCLIFTKPSGQSFEPHPVSCRDISALLERTEIPYAVFNACRSGWHNANGASLVQELFSVGCRGIVSMSYDIASSTIQLFTENFYKALFDGRSFIEATSFGRAALQSSVTKKSKAGFQFRVQDHVVPICHTTDCFDSYKFTADDLSQSEADEIQNPFTSGDIGLFGRDADVLWLESNLLLQSNIGVFHGLPGSGKTRLVAALLYWWRRTGLIGSKHIWLNCQLVTTFENVEEELLDALFPGNDENLDFDALEFLRQSRNLLIFDSLESCPAMNGSSQRQERAYLKRFLTRLHGGKSLVIVISRQPEDWLQRLSPGRQGEKPKTTFYQPLDGLDNVSGCRLFQKSAETAAGKDFSWSASDQIYVEHIVKLVDGNAEALIILGRDFSVKGKSCSLFFQGLLSGDCINLDLGSETKLSVARATMDVYEAIFVTESESSGSPSPALFVMTWKFLRTRDFWLYQGAISLALLFDLGISNADAGDTTSVILQIIGFQLALQNTDAAIDLESNLREYLQKLERSGWCSRPRKAPLLEQSYMTVHPLFTIVSRSMPSFKLVQDTCIQAFRVYQAHIALALPRGYMYWNPIWTQPRLELGLDFYNVFAAMRCIMSDPRATYLDETALTILMSSIQKGGLPDKSRYVLLTSLTQEIWSRAYTKLKELEEAPETVVLRIDESLVPDSKPDLSTHEARSVPFRILLCTQAMLASMAISSYNGTVRDKVWIKDSRHFLRQQLAVLKRYTDIGNHAVDLKGLDAMFNAQIEFFGGEATSPWQSRQLFMQEMMDIAGKGETIPSNQRTMNDLPVHLNGHSGPHYEFMVVRTQVRKDLRDGKLSEARLAVQRALDEDVNFGANSAQSQVALLELLVEVCCAQKAWSDAAQAEIKIIGLIASAPESQDVRAISERTMRLIELFRLAGDDDRVFALMLKQLEIVNLYRKSALGVTMLLLNNVSRIHNWAQPRDFLSSILVYARCSRYARIILSDKVHQMPPGGLIGHLKDMLQEDSVRSPGTMRPESNTSEPDRLGPRYTDIQTDISSLQTSASLTDQHHISILIKNIFEWLLFKCLCEINQSDPMAYKDWKLHENLADSLEGYLFDDRPIDENLTKLMDIYPVDQFRDFLFSIYTAGEAFLECGSTLEMQETVELPPEPPNVQQLLQPNKTKEESVVEGMEDLSIDEDVDNVARPVTVQMRTLIRLSGYTTDVEDIEYLNALLQSQV